MEEVTTREKIITEALRLFSQKGYNGVSMREIAAAVGIKGASIYNHFDGKEDLFQAIFQKMIGHYETFAAGMQLPEVPGEETVNAYLAMDERILMQMTEALFSFFALDEFMVMFRKLIISEQNNFPMAAECLKSYYLEAPYQFQKEIFRGMTASKEFRDAEPDIMALHFYSPIYYILSKFDVEGNYEESVDMLKRHVRWFFRLYREDGKA